MNVLTSQLSLHSAQSCGEYPEFPKVALQPYRSRPDTHSSSRPPAFHLTQSHLLCFTVKNHLCPPPTPHQNHSTPVFHIYDFMVAVVFGADLGWDQPPPSLTETQRPVFLVNCFFASILQQYLRSRISVKSQKRLNQCSGTGTDICNNVYPLRLRNRSEDDAAAGWNASFLTHLVSNISFLSCSSVPGRLNTPS